MVKSTTCISISGGIAVGKTSLASLLNEKFQNSYVYLEEPAENSFLSDFYVNMKKWAFHSRIGMISLFSQRFLKIKEIFDLRPGSIVKRLG